MHVVFARMCVCVYLFVQPESIITVCRVDSLQTLRCRHDLALNDPPREEGEGRPNREKDEI